MTEKKLPKEVEKLFASELERLDYGGRTIKIYAGQLNGFAIFIHPKHINSATPKEIKQYLDHLKDRKKLSPQTRSQTFWSLNFYYNNILKKNFQLDESKVSREYIRKAAKAISQEDLLKIIASSSSFSFTFRHLKYSYVKHLENNGYDIISILDNLGNNNSATVYQYLIMDREDRIVKESPLDLIQNLSSNPINTDKLKKKIDVLKNDDEKEYLNEAIDCFNIGILRPGVVFAWIAAIRNLQYKMLKHSLHSINASIQTHHKNAKDVRTIDDFAFIKESVAIMTKLTYIRKSSFQTISNASRHNNFTYSFIL